MLLCFSPTRSCDRNTYDDNARLTTQILGTNNLTLKSGTGSDPDSSRRPAPADGRQRDHLGTRCGRQLEQHQPEQPCATGRHADRQ